MNAQQQKANPHPKEYIIDKTILDEIEKGVDGEWGEGVFAKYWGGNAIRSRPHPAPTDEQCRICSQATAKAEREDALALLEEWDYHNNRNFGKPHPMFADMIRLVREKPDEIRKHLESLRESKEVKKS
jgi:hypothetical protein